MRVALVVLAPGIGGVSRHVFDLAEGLRQRGHLPELFGRGDAARIREAALAAGLRWSSLRRAPHALADVWHLHLHNTLDMRALPLIAARRSVAGGRVILTEHLPRHPRTDLIVSENLPAVGRKSWRKPGAKRGKTAMKKLQFGLCDSVIAVSRRSMGFLYDRYGLAPPKLVTVFNGVAVPLEPPPAAGGEVPMRVMAIGDLHWRKGFDILLDACGLAKEDWSLVIIGDGVARAELMARVARLHGWRSVRLDGYRRDGSRAALECDLVCVPSRAESFSYVVLEAMAAARPVVAADVDGTRDAILDGRHGLVVPADDPASLAKALDALATDPQWRTEMGQAAHARVRERFTIDRMVDATLAVYGHGLATRAIGNRCRGG